MSRVRRLAATATAVLTMAALTACQDPGAPNASNTPALAGPPPTAAQTPTSARHGGAGHASGAARPMTRHQLVRALQEGPAHAHWAHLGLVLRTPRQTMTGSGDVSYSRRHPAMRLEMAGSSGVSRYVEMVAVDGAYYLSVPGATPDGKFARIVPTAPGSPLGEDFGRISGELDPIASLVAMRHSFGRAHYGGRVRVYGESMTTYALHVRLREGLAARGVKTGLAQVPRRVTYRLWFDRHRLVRKLKVRLPGMRVSADFSRWGRPVHIHAPSPAQVVGPAAGHATV